ncbi:hypothetical protein CORC01_07665 [Colletotrichum orchidophilum]|uniref:Uncharacterized protein n=1 Tax=Colletotrichum orchidophilum TaxID=1209926 RepID=A0A1G4B6U9_9PEZI|nr:uncharacterized protein CORC01_07665 [Colletotrichum orchidophilum]OHE97056.1 hypothetical protein CORC01_07665 [Colletotrichum orchidophilum]
MISKTTYEPLLVTLTFTPGGFQQTKVLSMAPQTTPFTPPSGVCSVDIRCLVGKVEEFTGDVECLRDQVVAETTASLPTQCFPESYAAIWRPSGNTFSDVASVAYPGTACISGWTTACVTPLTLESGQTYTQTWCCPSSYTCLTPAPGGTPYRDCVSLLSTSTEVWINNIATSGGRESTLWSSWRKITLTGIPSVGPLSVKHPVFPLYGRFPSQGSDVGDVGLSTGAIAGIAVAAVVFVLLLLGTGLFVCLRKRKQKRAAIAAQNEDTSGYKSHENKGLGFDAKQELPGHSTEMREVDAATPPPVELSAYTRAAEVDGSRPAELS